MSWESFIEKHVREELIRQGFTAAVAQGGGISGCRYVQAHEPGEQEREDF